MMHAGLDVVRLNASHGTVAGRRRDCRGARRRTPTPTNARRAARPRRTQDRTKVLDGRVRLWRRGLTLDTELDPKAGTAAMVGVAYKDLPRDVAAGDTLRSRRADRAGRRRVGAHDHLDPCASAASSPIARD